MKPSHIKCLLASLLVLSCEQAIAGQPRVPKPIYLEGEILVRYRAQAPAASDPVQKRLGLTAKYSHSDGRTQLLRLPAFTTVESMLRVLRQDSAIELAEPNFLRFARTVMPNDPLFGDQWGLRSTGQANFATSDPALASVPGADMNLVQAWDGNNNDGVADRTGSSSVVVAVIDDAVQTTHPDFAANIVSGSDFANNDNNPNPDNADESHGTSVTGCIGAIGNNGLGVAGVAWNVKLMPLKFAFDASSLLAAMDFARDNGAKIVNMSFGGPGFSQLEQDKINALAANDILFVAAHGNDDSNTDLAQLNYPANYDAPNILSVAATNRQDNIASFSQYGSLTADVAAPGLQIVTTGVNSGYMTNPGIAGTSFSSPYAAGAAALLRSHVTPAPDFREIRARLIESGSSVSGANSRFRTSGGRIDVDKALDMTPGPTLVLKAFRIDSAGNQALDPGETVNVTATLENLWLVASNVNATLSADNGITVAGGTQALGTIGAGTTHDVSFPVTVPSGITGHRYVRFTLDLSTGTYSTQRSFLAEIGRVQNAVQIVQNFTDDLYDEYHAWHFTIPSTLAGTNTLVIRTSTPAPDNFDVDLLVKKDIPPQYSITVGINPEVDSGFFCTSGTQANCQDPDTLVSGRFDGKEGITVVNPAAGTYHMVVVNFAQTVVNYTLDAVILPGDLRPNDFSIPPKTNAASNSLVVSEPVTISGITAPTFITVEPQGEYSINNGAFTQADGMVGNGQQVRMRVLSATDAGTSCAVGLTIGGVEDFFLVQTGSGGTTGSITRCTKGEVIPPGNPGGSGGGGPMPQILLGVLLALSLLRLQR